MFIKKPSRPITWPGWFFRNLFYKSLFFPIDVGTGIQVFIVGGDQKVDPSFAVHLDALRFPVTEPGCAPDGPGCLFLCPGIIDPDFDRIVGVSQFPALCPAGASFHGIELVSPDVKALEGAKIIIDTKCFEYLTGLDLPALVKTVVLKLDFVSPGDPDTEGSAVRADGRVNVFPIGFLSGNPDLIVDGPMFF